MVKLCRRANFVVIGHSVAVIWRFLDFSKTAVVRHLGFVMRVFGTPTKGTLYMVFIAVQNLVGIDAIVLIIGLCIFSISRVWLENVYSRPQSGGFGAI